MADVILVNKADDEANQAACQTLQEYRNATSLALSSAAAPTPVIAVSARTERGIQDAYDAILSHVTAVPELARPLARHRPLIAGQRDALTTGKMTRRGPQPHSRRPASDRQPSGRRRWLSRSSSRGKHPPAAKAWPCSTLTLDTAADSDPFDHSPQERHSQRAQHTTKGPLYGIARAPRWSASLRVIRALYSKTDATTRMNRWQMMQAHAPI